MDERNFTPEQAAPCAVVRGADVLALSDRDLIVSIYPKSYRFYDFEGTRRQLEDEGLIAKDLVWPERDREVWWVRDGVRYELKRTRPADLKGPRKLWIEADWWQLRGRPTKRPQGNEIEIQIQRERLERMIFNETPEGIRRINESVRKSLAAQGDNGFQSFMDAVLPPPKKRKGAEWGQAS